MSAGGQEGHPASSVGHAIKALNNLMSAAYVLASSEAVLAADHTEIARWLSARIDQGKEPEQPAGRGPGRLAAGSCGNGL